MVNGNKGRLPTLKELAELPFNHPFGLLLAILLFAIVFLIFGGVMGCLIRIMIRLPFNLFSPEKITDGGICDPDRIWRVRLGEWIINLFQNQSFLIFIIIVGLLIWIFRKEIKKAIFS